MPRDFTNTELLGTFHFAVEARIPEEIRVRRLTDGDIDIRYFRAWDKKEPDVLKPTKGGFILSQEDFENFRASLNEI